METNSEKPSAAEASDALKALSADSEQLAAGVRVPWILLAALGGVAAWWVSGAVSTNPGADYEAPTSGWLGIVAVLVVVYLIRRETGVRFRRMGTRAGWAVAGIIVTCLVLFSVSLGLVSFGLHWAVVLTSVIAFATTTWLAGLAYKSAVDQLHRA